MILGYARSCRRLPDAESQADGLFEAGAEQVYVDDGTTDTLSDILLASRPGDAIVVDGFDVLAPDRTAFYAIMSRVAAHGMHLISVRDGVDTSAPVARSLPGFLRLIQRIDKKPEFIPERDAAREDGASGVSPDAGTYVPDYDLPDECFDWIPPDLGHADDYEPVREQDSWPDWLEPVRERPCFAQAAVAAVRPDWIPKKYARSYKKPPRAELFSQPGWIPGRRRADAYAGPVPEPVPEWIPEEYQKPPDHAVIQTDCWPDWIEEILGPVKPDRRPLFLFTLDYADWVPAPPKSQKRAKLPRKTAIDPAGDNIPVYLPENAAGRLPENAMLHPDAVPSDEQGRPVMIIKARPDAETASGPEIEPPQDLPSAQSQAEKLIIRQMREQHRIASLKRIAIAAVIAVLFLLGMLAIARPRPPRPQASAIVILNPATDTVRDAFSVRASRKE